MNIKNQIKEVIKEFGFKYNSETIYTLSSGKKSNYYIDCRKIILHPLYMHEIGQLFWKEIKAFKLDKLNAIGGLTLGADPIALLTCIEANKRIDNNYIYPFIVRKNIKSYGMGGRIVGNVKKGDKVVIVDDVMTSELSTLEAINASLEAKLDVVGVVVLVDRKESIINHYPCPFRSIFTIKDFI